MWFSVPNLPKCLVTSVLKSSLSLPIPILRDAALGYGLVNLIRSPDGVVRSAMSRRVSKTATIPASRTEFTNCSADLQRKQRPRNLI